MFNSFGVFNIGSGDTANFSNDSGLATSNILGRVTGGQISNVFGTIQTTGFGTANLFLMNPAGWIFGPSAQLNVGGSFHATTADYIKLGNDGIFFADPAKNSSLTSSAPSAFGFLSANPAPIEVQSGGVNFETDPATPLLLQVPEGQTLSLVGGNAAGSDTPGVSIGALDGSTPGWLLAPAGRVNLVSVASAGEAGFDGKGFNVEGFAKLGGIKVGPGSLVDGKDIFIRGGRLVIDDGVVLPGAFAIFGLALPPDGGEVNIKVSDDVTIKGTTLEPFTGASPGIFAYAGDFFNVSTEKAKVPDVNIDAGTVSISGFAGIQTTRNGPGDPGNVIINANTVNVGSGGSVALFNAFEGPGGNLIINAKDVNVSGDGSPSPVGFEGLGAQGVVSRAFVPTTFPEFANPDPRLITADSGNITINASNSLNVTGLGQITTDSLVFGRAGAITIDAGDIFLAGTGQFESGVIASQSAFAGDAGNVTINAANAITIKDGFRITSTSLGSGNAGNVDVTSGQSINLSNNGRILGRTNEPPNATLDALFKEVFHQGFSEEDVNGFPSLRTEMGNPNATMMEVLAYLKGRGDIQIPDLDLIPGDGGRVSVTTPVLTLNADASIQTSTGWEGNAGQIIGNVGSLSVNGGSFISSSSGIVLRNPDGTIIGPVVGTGDAGSITLTANDKISVSGSNSVISTSTFGDGGAGDISLSANQVNVQNGGGITSESGGTLAGQPFVGIGNAGQITVSTPTLTMGDGGTISVTTSGPGNAGNIALNVNNFTQTGGARVDSSTSGGGSGGDLSVTAANLASISGQGTGLFSTASSTGAGGDITVHAPQVQILDGATMSADSTGTATATAGNVNIVTSDLNMQNSSITTGATLADGGNISITTTGSIVHLTNSQITTSVQSGVGGGGNITIDSDLIILDDSRILANAFGGPGGNINITADVFLVNSGGTLPTSLAGIVDASSALSTPGTINVEAAFTDVSGEVAQLPEAPLQATELLRASCAARFAGGKASSLVLGGRDGVPIQPGGLLPSPLYLATEAGSPVTGVKTSANDLPARFSLLGSGDSKNRLLTQYSLLPNVKCAF